MIKLPNKIKLMFISMVYGMMVTVPAVAEDIEIYTAASSAAVSSSAQANVLFILDTSGSMGTTVQERAPFDSDASYTDSGAGCFLPDVAYILPYGSYYAWIHCDSRYSGNYGTPDELQHFDLDKFVCDAGSAIVNTGFYNGRISGYRSGSWNNVIDDNDGDEFIECEADQGIHGKISSGSKVWATDSGSNGWSSDEDDEIDWSSNGTGETLTTGKYANYITTAPVTNTGTRISIMQEAIKDLVDASSGINVGLMRFSSDSSGGMIAVPIDDIDDVGHKADLIDALDDMTASGGTPLSESFYEAAMYFQGKAVDYGLDSTPYTSVSASKVGSSYISPIVDECQLNYAVILTDGDPSGDSVSASRLGNMNSGTLATTGCIDNCLDEIAKSIGTNDQSSLDGEQVVSTFTIGFAIDNALLQDTANESFIATKAGERYLAEDAASLADVLNKLFASVYEVDTSFSSPAVAVNAFNRSTHLDSLYFTLFKPLESPHWAGNFKKYRLGFVESADDATVLVPKIIGANDLIAVDETTGFFFDDAKSFWSDNEDGKDVEEGGAANAFVLDRKVYTYTGSYTGTNGVLTPVTDSAALLTSSVNNVESSNSAITEAMLGVAVGEVFIEGESGDPDVLLRDAVLDWAEGIDVTDSDGDGDIDDARHNMGDPLHSEPALVQYGGTASDPILTAYVATNDGYLHAFDVDDGKELFSFIPQELLSNLDIVMNDTSGAKTYGLDGNVVAWVYEVEDDDGETDGIINSSEGEHVYLYIGMRRGGNYIYSVDVTDRNAPTLRWVIEGGTGDYSELGQTWSTINVEKIKDGSDDRYVLIFGGGYDTNQDGASERDVDSVGNAVFIADAESGDLLWSAGPSGDTVIAEMDYSIPARVKPLDLSADGYVDRLYVADMGGQIFRFDIDNDNGNPLASSITGGLIIDIAEDNSEADARRFYYPPDVSLILKRGESAYLAIGIASGYRAHPLNTDIEDRIYLFKDHDVYDARTDYAAEKVLTEDDLYDATINLVAGDGDESDNAAAQDGLADSEGWLIKLNDEDSVSGDYIGEKGLSEPLFLGGTLIVTTYTPEDDTGSSSCSRDSSGTGTVYFLDVSDASAAFPSDSDVRSDRHDDLSKEGIPPSPSVIITSDGQPTLCVGTECETAEIAKGARRALWYEVNK